MFVDWSFHRIQGVPDQHFALFGKNMRRAVDLDLLIDKRDNFTDIVFCDFYANHRITPG